MRQDLASGLARDRHDAVEKRRQVEIGHGRSIVHAAAAGPAARIADHTRSGVAGMSMSRTPSGARASSTALITAGGAPMAPASPQPFTPSGLVAQRVGLMANPTRGRSSARGRQQSISRSEEHTPELQSLMRSSYAVSCLKQKNQT